MGVRWADKAIRDLPGSAQARQRLVSASLEYLEGLAGAARGDLDLAREIGQGYWRVGRIQGVPVELNLGERAQAGNDTAGPVRSSRDPEK